MLTGRAPTLSAKTNYTFNITGMDTKANIASFNYTIVVTPNQIPKAKNSFISVNCTRGSFCSYTLPNNSFSDHDFDPLKYSDVTIYSVEGMKFSTLNLTYFGFPHERYINFTMQIAATDPYEARAFLTIQFNIHDRVFPTSLVIGIVLSAVFLLTLFLFILHANIAHFFFDNSAAKLAEINQI
jgi:hypothetical protein